MYITGKPSIVFLFFALIATFISKAQTITTISGNGTSIFSGDGGQAANATFISPGGIAIDQQGNKFICDKNRVRRIDASGIITTIAGTGTAGFSGDGGVATAAQLNLAYDIALDASGNIFISDCNNNRIRKIDITTGIITTVAGGGTTLNDGAPATTALLLMPEGICFDPSGNLYIADRFHQRIRKVNTSGIISTAAGDGNFDFYGDGGPATAASLRTPRDVAFDLNGNLLIADSENSRIRKVNTSGIISTISGDGMSGVAINNTPATSTSIGAPAQIALDVSGKIYIASGTFSSNLASIIYVQDNAGIIKHYAGNGNQGYFGENVFSLTALLNSVRGLMSDVAGDIYIADAANYRIRKITNTCLYPQTASTISGNSTICENGNAVYNAAPVSGATSYLWTIPTSWTGSSNTQTINITTSGTSVGVITVAPVNNCGAGIATSFTITPVNLNTSIAAIGPTAVCDGQSVHLQALTSGCSYQWMFNNNNIPNANNADYYATQAGNYTVNITCGGCSQTTSPIAVIINPVTSVTVTGASFVCENGSTILNANPATGLTYQWLLNGQIITGANSNSFTSTAAGTFSVVATNNYTCSDTSNTINMVVSDPSAQVIPLSSDNLCINDVELSGYAGNGCTYQWQLNNSNIPGAVNDAFLANAPGAYSVIVTNSDNCSDTSVAYNLAYNTGQAILWYPNFDTLCDGFGLTLYAEPGQNYTYQWLLNGQPIPNATGDNYFADSQGYYSIIVNENICTDTSDNSVYITVLPVPSPVITINGSMLSVPPVYNSYQWYQNGFLILGATSNTHYASQVAGYYVIVSDGYCEGVSDMITFMGVSIPSIAKKSVFSVYPNPFKDKTLLTFSNRANKTHTFLLYNNLGQLAQKVENITSEQLEISRGMLPSGIYFYRLISEPGESIEGQIVIE